MRSSIVWITRLVDRALDIGAADSDDEDTRLRKRGLLLTVWGVVLLAPLWAVVYFALGRPISGSIPLAYVIVSVVSLIIVARRGWSDHLRTSQVVLILFLPALLQWSLGGFGPVVLSSSGHSVPPSERSCSRTAARP